MSNNVIQNLVEDNNKYFVNNGLISDIRDTNYPKSYNNMFDQSSAPKTDELLNCNTRSLLQGILEETLLSNTFFSVGNIQNIQDMIRYFFYKEKNKIISQQDNNSLLTIMRSVYLKYSNSAADTVEKIKEEVKQLNTIVVEYSLQQIYINYDNYNLYINELEKLPEPIPLPKAPDKSNFTYDLAARNNM
tara:strand:+ start:44 stop:610 length:567 start_codon:yes stop_codon:yes gene_type:complete